MRERCVCIVKVDDGAIGSEGFNRMRCANAQGGHEVVYVWRAPYRYFDNMVDIHFKLYIP